MPRAVSAETFLNLCPDATRGTNFNLLCDLSPNTALPNIFTTILALAIILALLYLIYGGFRWITSSGDKGKVEEARNHIVAVIVGLILVFLSWFIINLLLQFFFGQGLNNSGISIPQIAPLTNTSPTPARRPSPTLTPTPTLTIPPIEGVQGENDEVTSDEVICSTTSENKITCKPAE